MTTISDISNQTISFVKIRVNSWLNKISRSYW